MRAAWILQGVGYAVLLFGLWYTMEQHRSIPPSLVPEKPGHDPAVETTSTTMRVRSPAFAHEEVMPSKYTCDGEDMSPPLAIEDVPEGTVSLALIMDDPDAPNATWDHWVVFNIPPYQTHVGEGEEPEGDAGLNSWGKRGFGGPCPPNGEHRYLFRVYALDTMLELPEGASKPEVLRAVEGHVLESATLMGRYARITGN